MLVNIYINSKAVWHKRKIAISFTFFVGMSRSYPGGGGGVFHPNWGTVFSTLNIWTLRDLTTSEKGGLKDLKRVFGKFEIGGLKYLNRVIDANC